MLYHNTKIVMLINCNFLTKNTDGTEETQKKTRRKKEQNENGKCYITKQLRNYFG